MAFWAVNGVGISDVLAPLFLTEATLWRPETVSVVRSPVSIPGRHGEIGSRRPPVFSAAKLIIVAHAHADADQDELEALANRFIALVSQPSLLLTRISGGLVTTAVAELESVTFSGFRKGRAVTLTAALAIPGVFLAEIPDASAPLPVSGDPSEVHVRHLDGSSAPIRGAVLRLSGPATSMLATDALTGTGISWAGSLAVDKYLFVDPDRLRAWISADWEDWAPAGTDVSQGVDYPAAGRLQMWPAVEVPTPGYSTVDQVTTRVRLLVSATGSTATTKLAVRAGRSFL